MDTYEICMLGPAGTGKTTLLASMIRDFKAITEPGSKEKQVEETLEAIGSTHQRIEERIKAIEMAMRNGEFSSECFSDIEKHDIYELALCCTSRFDQYVSPEFELRFHNFPSTWINDEERLEKVKFKESEIFLLPIDSTLIMEPVTTSERKAAVQQLSIESISNVAKKWAKNRAQQNKRGLFIIVPLKCETYFIDHKPHSVHEDQSYKLYKRICSNEYFGETINYIKEICPSIDRCYLPTDTMGCCFITRKNWEHDEQYGKRLKVTYHIPQGEVWSPYGPAHIVFKILHHIGRQDGDLAKVFGRVGRIESKFQKLIWDTHNYNRERILAREDDTLKAIQTLFE